MADFNGFSSYFISVYTTGGIPIFLKPGPTQIAISGATFAPSAYGVISNTMTPLVSGVAISGAHVYILKGLLSQDYNLDNHLLMSDSIKANVNTNNKTGFNGVISASQTGEGYILLDGSINKFPVISRAMIGMNQTYGTVSLTLG